MIRRVTCASPSYLAAHGRPEKPEDLRDHICVTFDNLASPEAWRFSSPKGDVLVPIRSKLTVTTAEAAIEGPSPAWGSHDCYLTKLRRQSAQDGSNSFLRTMNCRLGRSALFMSGSSYCPENCGHF